MLLVVAYDVTDSKRRLKIASELENYGKRVQYSVFECYLEEEESDRLMAALGNIVDPTEDSVRFYFICGKDEEERDYLGRCVIYRDEDYFMI